MNRLSILFAWVAGLISFAVLTLHRGDVDAHPVLRSEISMEDAAKIRGKSCYDYYQMFTYKCAGPRLTSMCDSCEILYCASGGNCDQGTARLWLGSVVSVPTPEVHTVPTTANPYGLIDSTICYVDGTCEADEPIEHRYCDDLGSSFMGTNLAFYQYFALEGNDNFGYPAPMSSEFGEGSCWPGSTLDECEKCYFVPGGIGGIVTTPVLIKVNEPCPPPPP